MSPIATKLIRIATEELPAARLLAIKREIMENLSNASLSIGTIAARHGITPRYVHMLFEAEGITFSAFVMQRRLEAAHSLLCDPDKLGSKISAIAFQCGFSDLSWFNRAFRKRYDATPSAIRATALKQRR